MQRPQLSSAEISQQRLQIGLAAGTGFLFVLLCRLAVLKGRLIALRGALMVKLVNCLYGRRDDESIDGRSADRRVLDEQDLRAST